MLRITNFERRHLLRIAAIAGVGMLFGLISCTIQQRRRAIFPSLFSQGELPAFDGATTWLNSPPLTPSELRGKVVLVQFWTYTCVNWLRTLPYVRAWAEKYKDKGLVVIGVHTPEFSFEKNLDNIRREAKNLGVEYPIAVDSDYAVWEAFNNHYWPALYFADAEGNIRHHHFGEGEYEQSEMILQRLLIEAGGEVGDEVVSVKPQGLEVAADWGSLKTPETYVGYGQAAGFASPGGFRWDAAHVYELAPQWRLNQWGLSGDWTVKREFAVLNQANGRVACCFHARDVNLVMGPTTQGISIPFRVFIDGKSAGAVHGADVDTEGNGTLGEQRTYQLVRQAKPIADRLFEIEFLEAGAEAYCFTFG
jgi:thiol-disulfide isomerase/thioredoxin